MGLLHVSLAFLQNIFCRAQKAPALTLKVQPCYAISSSTLLSCYRIDKVIAARICMVIHSHVWASDVSMYKSIIL